MDNTVNVEEVGFATRMYQLNQLHSKLKTKRKQATQKDKAITTISINIKQGI
jgi:hypothetical protein